MAKAVLELEAVTGNWDGGLKKAQTSLQNFIATNGGLHNAIQKNGRMMADAIAKMGNMESKAKTASGRLRDMESMFMQLGDAYQQMSAKERSLDVGRRTIESMEKLKVQILETKRNMQDLQKQIALPGASNGSGFLSGIGKGLIPGFGMGVGAAGAMMAVRGVQAAAGLAKDAIKYNIETNMEFEQSNANLSAVLGKTRDEMERLTEDAKRLGASTLYTANQITELQTVLARRGFGEEQILQMTHGISNLALATGTSLADAAELAASTMQAFGMHANEMERIVSVLGVSTTKSALTMEKLGTSLQYVAPTARAAGFSLEDTVAMLGKLVDGGLDASTAGTSLRQIILAMSTDNGKLARSFGRPVRSLEDFVEALNHVSDAEDLLSDASKEVRVTAVPALISLANSKDQLKELRGELDNVGGKLQEMADKQTATLRGQVTLLTSAWDGFMINLGNSEGTLKKAAKWLQELVSGWSASVALGNNAQSAIGVVFGAWDQHKLENDPGQTYLNKFNEYKESGKFDYDSKGRKLGEKERERAINEYIRQEYNALYEAEKKATDADIAVLDHYIKNRNENIRYKDEKGREQTQVGGIYYRQQLVQAIRKYDTEGELKGIEAHDIEGLIKLAAKLLGQKQFNDSFYSGVGQYAQDSLLQLNEKDKTKATLSVKGPDKQARDNVAAALDRRNEAMAKLAIEDDAGLIGNSGELYRKMLNIEEAYMDALASAAATIGGNYKDAFNEQVKVVKGLSSELAGYTELQKNAKERLKEEEAKNKALVDADNSIYRQMKSSVGRTAWDRIAQSGDEGKALKGRFAAMKVKLDGGMEIPDKDWEQFVSDLNEKLLSLKLAPIQLDLEAGTVSKMANEVKDIATKWGYVAQAVSSVGSAMQSIEDPSAKIAGIVATAVASTALGFAQASTADSKFGTFAWIASAAAGLANMTAMIASIKQVTAEYHADGGFVGGPKGSDVTNCWLTPGELVLNRAQQTNLAAQLQPANRGYGDLHMEKIITGEDIRIVLTNNARRRGGTGKNYAI